MDFTLLTVAQVALVAVTVGLVEVIKRTNIVADRFIPLVSIVVGIALAFVYPGISIAVTVLSGIVIGLSASGLYSGTKTVTAV